MKKLFFIAGMVAMTCTGFAQDMTFGAKAGLNLANIVGDDAGDDNTMMMGIFAGGYANFAMTDQLSIQPELVFSMQGTTEETEFGDVDYNLNYINIPVMAMYEVMDGLNLRTGPQLGILMSAEADFDGETVDIKDDLSSIDFSWGFGAGYSMEQGLSFDVRYNYGLTSIEDPEEGDGGDVFNGVIQMAVGYNF